MIGPCYRYKAVCSRVVDGDTYVLDIDLGFRVSVSIEGRLAGVNTPEIYGASREQGLAAKAYVEALLIGQPLIVESHKGARSFARWVVDITLPDGRDLAQALVESGYAVAV